ncbi:MAG: hypothetical protein R2726_15065 [Acidimicrobiales bacterium]
MEHPGDPGSPDPSAFGADHLERPPTRRCRRPSSRRLARSRMNHPATGARELARHPRLVSPHRRRDRCTER